MNVSLRLRVQVVRSPEHQVNGTQDLKPTTNSAATGNDVTVRRDDGLPRVVRGSILIRNAIDTTGGPRHIDVVADWPPVPINGGLDGGQSIPLNVVVEDNVNMFDGTYRQVTTRNIALCSQQSPGQQKRGVVFSYYFCLKKVIMD